MSTPLSDGVTIRFTVDGSEPTDASLVYSGPVLIRNTTKFAARAFMEQLQGYPLLTTRLCFVRFRRQKSRHVKVNDIVTIFGRGCFGL